MSGFPESDLVLRKRLSCFVMAESLPSDELRLAAVAAESIEPPAAAFFDDAPLFELPSEDDACPPLAEGMGKCIQNFRSVVRT